MSKGPHLTESEIEEARQFYGEGLTWRQVGKLLGRDYSALCRKCGGSRSQKAAQNPSTLRALIHRQAAE
jgi:hypothetical protein